MCSIPKNNFHNPGNKNHSGVICIVSVFPKLLFFCSILRNRSGKLQRTDQSKSHLILLCLLLLLDFIPSCI